MDEADAEYGSTSSVGVGLAGIVDRAGISFSVNVPCLNGKNVQTDLSQALDRDVRCINDVRAFALSEARGGAAEGFGTMVGVILGTGAASGYCRGGIPRLGTNGVAGEWGHLPIASTLVDQHNLPLFRCSCGALGCIELYVAGPGLARLAHHCTGDDIDTYECLARMRRGDKSALAAFDIWIDCVAGVFAQLILHVNPDAIVIVGGLSDIAELYDRLPAAVNRILLPGVTSPPIRRAVFGDDSGARGAAIVGLPI